MSPPEPQPWWIVVAGMILPLAVNLWLRSRDDRKSDQDRASTERARLMATMDAETLASFKRLQEDVTRERGAAEWERKRRMELETENQALERDRDRGWDLARAWRAAAGRLRHDLNNLIQSVSEYVPEGRRAHLRKPAPPLPDVDKIEDIAP